MFTTRHTSPLERYAALATQPCLLLHRPSSCWHVGWARFGQVHANQVARSSPQNMEAMGTRQVTKSVKFTGVESEDILGLRLGCACIHAVMTEPDPWSVQPTDPLALIVRFHRSDEHIQNSTWCGAAELRIQMPSVSLPCSCIQARRSGSKPLVGSISPWVNLTAGLG